MQTDDMAKLQADLSLPGRLILTRGAARDYDELARFHYCGGRPATWAGVWTVRYFDDAQSPGRVVAVGVLSQPPLNLQARNRYFAWQGKASPDRWRFINENIRTISRVIVHPQFRSLGLSTLLVCRLCRDSPTRYVESIAVMGRFHPLFERAGLRRVNGADQPKAYFIWDRMPNPPSPSGRGLG